MRVSAKQRNAMVDSLTSSLNSGFFDGYSGTRPADADTALSGNTLLFSLGFAAAAFSPASAGTAAAAPITSDPSADASGMLSFGRLFAADHTTAVADVSVGTSGAEASFNTLSMAAGAQVSMTSMTVSMPTGT